MITFDSQEIPVPAFDEELIRRWIISVAEAHGFAVGRLSYLFCDDDYILEANKKFLGHDYYTDIITFDSTRYPVLSPKGDLLTRGRIGGDIILSVDTVASNAAKLQIPEDQELMRVIIHGVLHLCGIDDKGPGEREIMEANEDAALKMLHDLQSKQE